MNSSHTIIVSSSGSGSIGGGDHRQHEHLVVQPRAANQADVCGGEEDDVRGCLKAQLTILLWFSYSSLYHSGHVVVGRTPNRLHIA